MAKYKYHSSPTEFTKFCRVHTLLISPMSRVNTVSSLQNTSSTIRRPMSKVLVLMWDGGWGWGVGVDLAQKEKAKLKNKAK